MNKSDLRIVFMGTPDFAVASLDALVSGGYNVVACVTMPDKPAGRGHHLITSPVKEYALAHHLPVLQPERLKSEEFLSELRSLNAQLFIVVAFRMLPEVVWSMPSLGTFNLHGSLLPKYRGAAPINWAVINGEKETGVTTFFLQHEIDTGDLILQERIPIGDDENVGSVHDRLMTLGASLVTRTTDLIIDCASKGIPVPTVSQSSLLHQPSSISHQPSIAPKIFKETCQINLSQTAEQVKNFVRGLSPYPAAWTNLTIGDRTFENTKIFSVRIINSPSSLNERFCPQGQGLQNIAHSATCYPRGGAGREGAPLGGAVADEQFLLGEAAKRLLLHAADGDLEILELQVPGKKRLTAKDFLNGLK